MRGIIPVYINNFNLLTTTKAMAEWFSLIRGVVPIIVDNASTYQPLLDWYANKNDCPYELIRLDKNYGHHAPWNLSCITWGHTHRARFGNDFYAVTDPDLDFEGVPWDLFDVCIEGFDQLREAIKVGIGLRIDDIPLHSSDRVRQCEVSYWTKPEGERYFRAPIDTTFAVYRASTEHRYAMNLSVPTLRTNAPYIARHVPWYWEQDTLNAEQRFYFANANASNSWKPSPSTSSPREDRVILTSYLTSSIDVQRDVFQPIDDESKLTLLKGARKLGLRVVVLHDKLTDSFCEKHSTDLIKFVRVPPVPPGMTVYSYRHVVQLRWLEANICESVFCTGLFDVQVQSDPHLLLSDSHRIWCGIEPDRITPQTGPGQWIIRELERGYGAVPAECVGQQLLNADIWGAKYSNALPFLRHFVNELKNSGNAVTDMPGFNVAAYRHIGADKIWKQGAPLHSAFKHYETRSDVAFIHK